MYINNLPSVLVDYNVYMYAADLQLYISTRKKNTNSCVDSINCDLVEIGSLVLVKYIKLS